MKKFKNLKAFEDFSYDVTKDQANLSKDQTRSTSKAKSFDAKLSDAGKFQEPKVSHNRKNNDEKRSNLSRSPKFQQPRAKTMGGGEDSRSNLAKKRKYGNAPAKGFDSKLSNIGKFEEPKISHDRRNNDESRLNLSKAKKFNESYKRRKNVTSKRTRSSSKRRFR